MGNIAVLFSGQGSQYPGMGQELLELCPEAGQIWEAAGDILGFDLRKACLNNSAEELAQTEISQPAILAVSLTAYTAVRSLGVSPDMIAGHSLGEYAAMAASGMLSLEDSFRVIKARAHAMAKCAKEHPGSMCAVMGLSPEEIETVCRETEGYVVPVNYNSPAQTVIAGETAAVEKAVERFSEMGKRCIRLAVTAAFHTKLMQSAAEELKETIHSIQFRPPQADFYSNTTAALLNNFSDMPSYLARHLVSPVRFADELIVMQQAGAEQFIECGPGKVLTGLVRKTLENVAAYNVENAKTFSKFQECILQN